MKLNACLPIFATLALAVAANAANAPINTPSGPGDPSPFQIRYFANLSFADSYVDISNDGLLQDVQTGSPFALGANISGNVGNICANVYTFDANEEMVSCCTCPVTPNGLKSLSVKNDLVSNTLTPGVPLAVVVKLVATTPIISFDSTKGPNGTATFSGNCDATVLPAPYSFNASAFDVVVFDMHAWGTTPHLNTANGQYNLTETEFSQAFLGYTEAHNMVNTCGFINSVGSGFGICKSCLVRGLGAAQQ